ncbi:basic amino acid ABC transporter substrate-binding protein [Fusobacterium sp. IOR10]|uniref:basic amino acid ABC transporter substrate-binding protein n=1 Tax=Fusobacterium sp. IOR10 TaxID=2665157 RepID=UPI0013D61DF2|nr:basic amino acid ABC transporter substrate-binding protein [Fusobacterium sp. IOR10]
MKNKISSFMIFFMLIISSFTFAKGQDKLIVGTDATEFQPFEYMENGEITGFDIELIKEIGKVLGKEVEFKNISFSGLLPALQVGKLDAVIAGLTVTDERKKYINFSESYYTSKQLIIVNKNNNKIKSLDDLEGYKVGVVLGCTGDLLGTEMKDKIKLNRYNTTSQCIIALNHNKIDAIILDSEPAKNFVKHNEKLKLINNNAAKEEYAIAIRKKDKELLKDINYGLNTLKENGVYKKLSEKYFIQD